MPDESNGRQTISTEDIESLERIVQQFAEGNLTKIEAIGSLSVSVATICARRNIVPHASIIQPYVEQLDAHDRENAAARARSNTADTGNQPGGGEPRDTGQTGDQDQSVPNETAPNPRRQSPAEGSDEEGEERPPAKKKRVDPSKFSWNDETKVFLDSFAVTPAHEKNP
ncbi:hypothetical protein BDP27DRAFT_1359006 [Rhodocollybia butyracea]|uniref:Uncharacterized protein n=1 Tax=Rhodocollybia butyracea TaxID=206335 RepID=A0A9P5Q4J4_9AGAR|nr:hypothetical protein BDP27DRAFT_1359006 [Rhodocollybia butyracea]